MINAFFKSIKKILNLYLYDLFTGLIALSGLLALSTILHYFY